LFVFFCQLGVVVRENSSSQVTKLFVIITFKQHAPKEDKEDSLACRRRLWCFFLSCLFLLLRSDTKILIYYNNNIIIRELRYFYPQLIFSFAAETHFLREEEGKQGRESTNDSI